MIPVEKFPSRIYDRLLSMEFALNRRSRLMTPRRSIRGVTMLEALLLVMLGASAGAAARFLITHYFSQLSHHHGFPVGTLMVNVLGSFIVGYVLTWSADHTHDRWRLLAATGFCGGFTTFSAFAYESIGLWRDSQWIALAANMAFNNVLAFAALILGVALHQRSN